MNPTPSPDHLRVRRGPQLPCRNGSRRPHRGSALPAHELTGRTPDLGHFWGPGGRELRRRFHDAVGLSPKLLARILRFRDGVDALARAPGLEKGRLALRLGYYDQAHFGRDFQELAGVSGGFLEERRGVRFVQADRPEEAHLGPPAERSS